MERLQWMSLWDRLRDEFAKKNSWGKNEIIALMDRMEREELRRVEIENQFEKDEEEDK